MQVILLQKVRNKGKLGDVVNVKAGYARNFLVPHGKAVFATQDNVKLFESRKAEFEKAAAEELKMAQDRATKFTALAALVIEAQASEEGKLFGSVGLREITMAIVAAGVEVDKHEIDLPNGPIHQVGEHEVNILLHSDVTVPVKISVVAQA
jgi:large subunit ribosomal protein L9